MGGWRAVVYVELQSDGPQLQLGSWLPIPADGPGLSYTAALDLAVTHVRGGRRACIMAPDGTTGREIPIAYARECSPSVGPLFDRSDGGGAPTH